MIKATLSDKNIKTKKLWAAFSWDYCTMITFFKEKPIITDYTELDNKDLIVGDMSLGMFELLFDCDLSQYLNERGLPKTVDISEVFQIEITGHFNEYDMMLFNEGGW